MSNNIESVIAKVKKLLALATSSNPNEAASAAAMAQDLMTKYSIESAALEAETAAPKEAVGAQNMTESRVETWKRRIGVVVAKANNCKVFLGRNNNFMIVGTPSDAKATSYIYTYICAEIERLARAWARDYTMTHSGTPGRIGYSNFRFGAAAEVCERITAAHVETVKRLRLEAADSTALARIETGLAAIEKRNQEVALYVKSHYRLTSGSRTSFTKDDSAYAAGRSAGASINLSRGGAAALGPTR